MNFIQVYFFHGGYVFDGVILESVLFFVYGFTREFGVFIVDSPWGGRGSFAGLCGRDDFKRCFRYANAKEANYSYVPSSF